MSLAEKEFPGKLIICCILQWAECMAIHRLEMSLISEMWYLKFFNSILRLSKLHIISPSCLYIFSYWVVVCSVPTTVEWTLWGYDKNGCHCADAIFKFVFMTKWFNISIQISLLSLIHSQGSIWQWVSYLNNGGLFYWYDIYMHNPDSSQPIYIYMLPDFIIPVPAYTLAPNDARLAIGMVACTKLGM